MGLILRVCGGPPSCQPLLYQCSPIPCTSNESLRMLKLRPTESTKKNEISTFPLSISFAQAQLCAYSIKTKYYEVDNVIKTNLSPVERKCRNVGRFTKHSTTSIQYS